MLYRSDEELLDVAIPFLSEGVTASEPTFVKLGQRTQQLILDALEFSDGVTLLDVDSGKALEALCRQRNLYARVAAAGYTHIRVLGEPPQEPWRDWVRLEALANRFHADLPVWSVCTYDLRTTDPSIIEDARQTHTHLVLPDQVLLPNPRFRDPEAFLAARARLDLDPAEAFPPKLRLIDPTPAQTRQALHLLASETPLSFDSANALALSAGEVAENATEHGQPPVEVRAWVAEDRVVVAVHDCGSGPADLDAALIPDVGDPQVAAQRTLGLVYQAVTHITLAVGSDGFTVRMIMPFDGW